MTQAQITAVVTQAEHQMDVQGYVRFSDIWKATNMSRQRIDQVLQSAVKSGAITQDKLNEWKASYSKSNIIRSEFALTKANKAWLVSHSEELGISTHDLLNRILREHCSNFRPRHLS